MHRSKYVRIWYSYSNTYKRPATIVAYCCKSSHMLTDYCVVKYDDDGLRLRHQFQFQHCHVIHVRSKFVI